MGQYAYPNSISRPVYFKIGTINGDKRPRYIRAGFNQVVIDGITGIEPDGFGGDIVTAMTDFLKAGGLVPDTEDGWRRRYSDTGWTDEFIFLEPQQMGDASDTLWGLNGLGLL